MRILRVMYDVDQPNVYCRIRVGTRKMSASAPGFSRCEAHDKWNEATGKELAYARALKKATARYLRKLEHELHNPEERAKIAPRAESMATLRGLRANSEFEALYGYLCPDADVR